MKWSSDLAYAVGLITTDGSLSIDERHINLTSKDLDQIQNFIEILGLTNKIGTKSNGHSEKRYYTVQFGNVKFYRFLLGIGLTPHKTKTIGSLKIPDRYFADFLRGHLDGDGYTYSYFDPRWKASFMLYTGFISASKEHLEWIRNKIEELYSIKGKMRFQGKSTYSLKYAKKNSIILLRKLYYKEGVPYLKRKRSKIIKALGIINKLAGMGKLVNPLP